jgi:SAM-dependent methyltransferase
VYVRSARFFDLLYRSKDYAAAADDLHAQIQELCPAARSLLDVACGTGKHLEHLRERYEVEGLDLDANLLAMARSRCSSVLFHQADMVDFDLDRTFDVVTCLFSSIAYVRTVERLGRAVGRMARHVAPHGLLVIEPWVTSDRFLTGRVVTDVIEDPPRKIVRMFVAKREETLVTHDVEYLVGSPDGVERFNERHEMGLFEPTDFDVAFGAAGFKRVRFDPKGLFGMGLYMALRS